MIKSALVTVTILMIACSNLSEKIEPKFYSDYFTGLEAHNISSYEKAVLDYDLTAPNGENIHFSNCAQVDDLEDGDVVEREFHLYTMLKLNCKALKAYTKAASSAVSFLDELLVKKDIEHLPATSYPYVSDYDQSMRLNKLMAEYQEKLEVKVLPDGAINVVTETDTLLYQIIATGDFNNDKIQDALIRIDWNVIGAFGKGSKLVMITKKSKDGKFLELSMQ